MGGIAGPGTVYRRRTPEKTVLYRVLAEHLETFLQIVHADPSRSLPRFVERELRGFLDCGILARGFARVHCRDCGKDALLAFSCKGRGFCPSCGGRRMAETAAHLIDAVLPEVPVRQWVLSLPYEARFWLAYDPKLLSGVRTIYLRALDTWMTQHARRNGFADGRTGAVCFVQRFDSAIRLNVHFHVLMLDGVYRGQPPSPFFHETPPPSNDEVALLTRRIAHRVLRFLRKSGRLADDTDIADEDAALAELTAAAVQGRQALGAQTGAQVTMLGRDPDPAPEVMSRRETRYLGFSLHANVRVSACGRENLERLIRYVARPAIANERLTLSDNGSRVIYKLKRVYRDGSRAVAYPPLTFIERLVALVPRPRYPLVTYHGVLAPAARLRPYIVPTPPPREDEACSHKQSDVQSHVPGTQRPRPRRRYKWAELLRRVFAVDALECDACGGRREIIAFLTDLPVVRKILAHLGLPTDSPIVAPARAPPGAMRSQMLFDYAE
ncbi:MAG: transposase [Candidatus Binatia bacterium]